MKISEMSTIQAASVLVKLSGPLSRIMKNGKLKEVFQGLASHQKDQNMFEAVADLVDSVIPMLFEENLQDTFVVISVMCGKTIEAVQKQNIMKTIADIHDFTQDREFIDFLGSLRKQTGQTDGE